jgi:two-component system, cell cycle sensor histidine kinase and response regulator CckA
MMNIERFQIPHQARQPRVLVVDDDEDVRGFAERVLLEAGYEVLGTADGPTALRLVADAPPFDLFVLDVTMPQMRGDELARQLRTQNPDVRVLYLTGHSDQLFLQKGSLWEHEAFIEKPVSVAGLRQAVSLLLFGHIHGPESDR